MTDKKVILITGGSDGLGRAIAKRLNSQYTVIILSPTRDKLKKVASEIGCDYVTSDVSIYGSVQSAVKTIKKKYGRIDCLINNAGLWIEGELDENEPRRMEEVAMVNFMGVIFMTKAVIPLMKTQKSGLVININSQGGLYVKPKRSLYTATKWGITGFTKSMQSELAPYGISVTGIYPGKMNTPMFEKIGIKKDMSDAIDPDDVAKIVEFLLTLDPKIVLPEIGIKSILH